MILLESYIPSNTLNGELLRTLIVLMGFVFNCTLVEGICYLVEVGQEVSRKITHTLNCLLIACWPWIFGSPNTPLFLGIIALVAMVMSRKLGLFPSVYGVKRKSYGDLLLAITGPLLFYFSFDKPNYFFLAFLILSLSDSLAAIVGERYQYRVYRLENGDTKSLIGATAFFLSSLIILAFGTTYILEMPLSQAIILSITLSLTLTLIEGISSKGTDNFFLPTATVFMLKTLSSVPTDNLINLALIQLLIFLVAFKVGILYSLRAKKLLYSEIRSKTGI